MEKQEYFYYFENGGWNSEFATSIEEARQMAEARWAHLADLTPAPKTFKPVKGNEAHYRSLLNMFY